MCFDFEAEPPISPLLGSQARGESIILTSRDGTSFAAYAGHREAAQTGGPAIVVLPDVRGLFSFYEELAMRFAEAGVEAVAIDYFGRTAGMPPRDQDFDFMSHVMQTKIDTVSEDVAAAVAYLRRPGGAEPTAIFTVGFCFGGRNSFIQATNKLGLAGVIGFYGSPGPRGAGPSVIELAPRFECPVLGLFGGADEGIPASIIQEFGAALAAAQVEQEMVIYPGAPHSFFDRKQEQYAHESADAWGRMQAFIKKHTPQGQSHSPTGY